MDNQLKVKVSQQPISSKHLPMFITSVLIMLTINFTIKYVAHSDLSLVELLHTYMPFALGKGGLERVQAAGDKLVVFRA